jgi:hypothetical protein
VRLGEAIFKNVKRPVRNQRAPRAVDGEFGTQRKILLEPATRRLGDGEPRHGNQHAERAPSQMITKCSLVFIAFPRRFLASD